MKNHLAGQTSPYLLQHAENPVDWYPWGEEAFSKAKAEDKPVFLSIGYSTCHWCHVMAHESFASEDIAELLNRDFVAVKVDKEERPDIDSVYMAVTQAMTGSGGWPNTVFLTPDQKPFFAGTYFPKTSRHGYTGLMELLTAVREKWREEREALLGSADSIVEQLSGMEARAGKPESGLPEAALRQFQNSYDRLCGGFGNAPKFPAAHNLLFLMSIYEKTRDRDTLNMVEKTLQQMYYGGLFDHIGYGFSRYSTDRKFLVPHFEKMLYDNALLLMAYSKVYTLTGKALYREVAEKTADYLCRELQDAAGGFYCAQDADSEGVEGKYYVFTPEEITHVLGGDNGIAFSRNFDITPEGNFEGRSIPNLLDAKLPPDRFDFCLPILRDYRKRRSALHLDRKILTAWNGLTIAAFVCLFKATRKPAYLETAKEAQRFLSEKLQKGNELCVRSYDGAAGGKGFLDDYAYTIFGLLFLYEATLETEYLDGAKMLYEKAVADFYDDAEGGFHLYGRQHETLILNRKETYDGAMPSGNSVMAYNLVKLSHYDPGDAKLEALCAGQLRFMSAQAAELPSGYAFFLTALLMQEAPPMHVTAVLPAGEEIPAVMQSLPMNTEVTVLKRPTREYALLDGKTTYYVCRDRRCLPPSNELLLS